MAEERDLKPGEMIYLGLSSKKKPSYGGSKNWIIIQDSDTPKKIFTKTKEDLNIKITPFLKKIKAMKKNAK